MPIKHIDPTITENNPFANCKLGRQTYADILTSVIRSFPDGFVLAINNEWGTGKTVFAKMWQQQLINKGFKTLYFNAWENDFEVNPLTAILAELKHIVPKEKQKLFKPLLKNAAIFTKELVPAVLKQLVEKHAGKEMAELIEAGSKASVDILKEEIDRFTEKQKGILEFKISLEKYLKENNSDQPLVFLIDELDRCRPNYSVEFLEKIKHFFAVKGIVFVLIFDKAQLSNAIKGVYGSDRLDADNYLRKFIDLEYSIPEPSSTTFCAYLYEYYDFKAFFENENRIQYSSFRDEVETFITFSGLLFVQKKLTLREQEKIFAKARLILKSFEPNQYLFPNIFIFLIWLSIYQDGLYSEIKNANLSLQEFVNGIEMYLPFLQTDPSNSGIMRTEALLLHLYLNEYRKKDYKAVIIKHVETGPNLVLVKTKYADNNERMYDLLSSFARETFEGLSLNHFLDRIDLVASFNN